MSLSNYTNKTLIRYKKGMECIITSNMNGQNDTFDEYRSKWRINEFTEKWEGLESDTWVLYDPHAHGEIPKEYWEYESKRYKIRNSIQTVVFDEAPILPLETPKTIEFPVDALPIEAKELVIAGYKSLEIPYEFIGLPVLVALSTAVGSHYEVAVNRTLSSKPILFVCLIASAGSGKSPSQKIAMNPIYEYQDNKFEEYDKKKVQYYAAKEEYDRNKKAQKKTKAFGEENESKLQEPRHPVLNEIYSTDATTEALAKMLESNKHGVVMIQDEFLKFYYSLGGYKQGKGGDLETYLSFWNGYSTKINRVGKPEPIILSEPFVNILGAMTPSGIEKICTDSNDENGFLDRFLFAFPTDIEMMRTTNEGIEEHIEHAYKKLIHRLIEMDTGTTVKVTLDEQSKKIYFEYENRIIAEAGSDEKKRSIYSKIKLYSLRLALIIHLCNQNNWDGFGQVEPINSDSMTKGINLAEYFKEQQNKIYQDMLESQIEKQLVKSIKFIREKSIKFKIGKRELGRYMRLNADKLNPLINELVDRHILKESNAGTKKKMVYDVNPKLFTNR